MKEINLNEYISAIIYFDDNRTEIKNTLIAICEEVINLCADNAEADVQFLSKYNIPPEDYEVYVLKNSILNCKEFIK
jgi:hypothetical protein